MQNSTWTRNVIHTMTWIWISIKTDVQFCITCTRVSVRAITDTSISSQVSLLRLFYVMTRSWSFDCSRQNKLVENGTVDVPLDFKYKKNVLANTTAYYFIIHDCVVQYNPMTLYAKSPKCILRHDIKSTIRCNRPQSSRQDLSLTRNLSWRKWRCWNRRQFSHITFLRVPCYGYLWQDPTNFVLLDWVLITMDCDGRTERSHTAKRLITAAVFEDDTIVYVKGREKRT